MMDNIICIMIINQILNYYQDKNIIIVICTYRRRVEEMVYGDKVNDAVDYCNALKVVVVKATSV